MHLTDQSFFLDCRQDSHPLKKYLDGVIEANTHTYAIIFLSKSANYIQ